MTVRLSKRRSHTRHLKNGKTTVVRECWVLMDGNISTNRNCYRHACPSCGSEIISVHMPNGGWAHFEGMPGLTRIKHPCMHIGESIRRISCELTLDLFDKENDNADL